MKRSVQAAAIVAFGTYCAAVPGAGASEYPTKPVRVVVTVSAGSGGDLATRTITPKLSDAFGHQFLVDNRIGFSGNIGAETVARAAPDGYTLLVIYAGNAISQSFHTKPGYRLDKDFTAVGQFASVPLALVVQGALGVKTVKELIALGRSRPKELHYASPGNGSLPHLAARLFEMQAGIDMVHVPYKSTTTAISELVGGQTAATFAAIPTAQPHVDSGRLRLMGISAARRSALVPAWPTLAESGLPAFDVSQWYGLVAPIGTPRSIVGRLSNELVRIVASAETRDALTKRGIDPVTGSPENLAVLVRSEMAKWAKVVGATGDAKF